MKQRFLHYIYRVAYYSGLIALCYFTNRHKRRVLTYHNIIPDELLDDSLHLRTSHSSSAFDAQLEIISKRWPDSERQLDPDGSGCLITFDDGYCNQARIAAPILEKWNRYAIFFLTTDLIANGNLLWPDRLLFWVSYVPFGRYRLAKMEFDLTADEQRPTFWSQIWRQIIQNQNSIKPIADAMEISYPFEALQIDPKLHELRFFPLSATELSNLQDAGHLLGGHSYGHGILARLDDQTVKEDFTRCLQLSEDMFNCSYYSYPFGGSDEVSRREQNLCRMSGFTRSFLNVDQVPSKLQADHYGIPRTTLSNTTNRFILEAELSGFKELLKKWAGKN